MIVCPLCGGNSIGKVGSHQFYCWNCFVEFSIQKDKVAVYEVGDDGSLIPYILENKPIAAEGNKC